METQITKTQLWTGRILSGIVILFMLFDGIMKFVKPVEVVDVTVNELGYQEHHILAVGLLAFLPTILYMIPRTSVLGAVFLTAYLGGAVATNLRVDAPLFSHILFPVYMGILLWVGLWLRTPALKSIFPLSK